MLGEETITTRARSRLVQEDIVTEKLQDFPDSISAHACHGHLTTVDYAGVIPHIQDKLARHKKLRAYTELAPDFVGIDPGARWDHTKFGFGHLFDFERGAFVSDVTRMNRALQVFALFIPGQWRAFPTAEASKAREWIVENQQ
jgi:SpoIIAA-like